MIWMYADEGDPMGGQVRSASVQSNNTLNLDFPYQGEQRGVLTLRTHPRHGKDVILRIQRGQIQCGISDGCQIPVRFDDQPATVFRALEAADHDSTVIFIQRYDKFLAAIRKAKVVRFEITLFHQGGQVLEFNVSQLNEGKLSGKK